MDGKLYNVLMLGDQNSFREFMKDSDPNLLHQVTFQKDTVLHVAAKFDWPEIAEMIIDTVPSLMYQKNSKGDTPLHIAARLGCQGIVAKILDYKRSGSVEVESNEELVRMVNLEKDTALHEAARSGHLEIVNLLIQKDSGLVNLANDKCESPLFIAVDKRHFKTAILICDKAGPSCSYQGRNKMNALHAAITRLVDEGEMLVRATGSPSWSIFDVFDTTPAEQYAYLRLGNRLSWRSMINFQKLGQTVIVKLTEKCPSAVNEADNFGWTPLHCAAHLGYSNIIKDLLQANRSTAHSKTDEGISALHIAAKQGHVSVLQKFHESCPDIWDLEDNRGRTALHVAAENGKVEAVKYILKCVSKDLINQKDIDGNTSLHLATIRGHHSTLQLLRNDKRVDKTAMNKNGLSVTDIIQSKKELPIHKKVMMSLMYFVNVGGLRSLEQVLHADNTEGQTKARANYEPKYVQETEEGRHSDQGKTTDKRFADTEIEPKEGNLSYDRLGQIASTNLLVTTLIATVSFAAAFTVPGGFKNDGPEEGVATLIKKASYKAFVLANALAFFWSMHSMYFHYNASFLMHHDALKLKSLLDRSIRLTRESRTALLVAFITGSYAALDGSRGLAVAVVVIGFFPGAWMVIQRNSHKYGKFIGKCLGLLLRIFIRSYNLIKKSLRF